ncbi:hypothetical protein AVEN_171911-1 [Araneus ventricosus]|uniref:Uncharacterized protein n=1 Tax=Araneus ventricosus TaxID=182803 RepID=A0A4Y2RBS0_ARAVE|nr:hypothetical protein AVEN_171911-1 [Araneus ventricosus]
MARVVLLVTSEHSETDLGYYISNQSPSDEQSDAASFSEFCSNLRAIINNDIFNVYQTHQAAYLPICGNVNYILKFLSPIKAAAVKATVNLWRLLKYNQKTLFRYAMSPFPGQCQTHLANNKDLKKPQ